MSSATWFRLLGLSFILAVVILVAPGWTQAPAGKKVALLVGVRQYKRDIQFPALQYTENDVVKLAEILRSPAAGFSTVRLLTTTRGEKNGDNAPTLANIRNALLALMEDRSSRDTVLIALSGHGVELDVEDPDGKGKNRSYSYFCPSDADLVGVSWSTGRSKWLLNLDELFGGLGHCGAGAKLVLMDACRHEMKVKKESSTRSLNAESVYIPRGVGAFFSCSAGQYAHEATKLKHGVFFHFVLEGLKGKARRSDRKDLTWNDLVDYVTDKVIDEASGLVGERIKQTPHPINNIPGKSPVLIGPEKEAVVKGWGKQIENSIGMKLVRIPAGKFTMGSPKDEKGRDEEDEEQHPVEITKEFWLGIHEVTQKQFKDVMGYNPSHFSRDGEEKAGLKYHDLSKPAGGKAKVPADTSDFPVENVSWEEADEFCKKLSSKFSERGRKYRLPTEAEWEYSCRGGAPSQPFHFGNSLSSKQANFDGNYPYGGAEKGDYLERSCKVGGYEKNRFGLYDMHGNVWEWCIDWYAKDYYGKSPLKDPQGPSEGSFRVIRGGSWGSGGWDRLGRGCRSADRHWDAPASRNRLQGFRVALVPLGK